MKTKFISSLWWFLFLVMAPTAKAQVFTLPALSSSQTDSVFRTMAADLAFRPVAPAGGLGSLWGLAVGVVGTMTSASQMNFLSSSSSNIYAADLVGTLQIPFGLAAEVGILPGVTMNGTVISQFGGDIRWTLTQDFLTSFPFDVALRGMYTTASASYSQSLNGSPINVSYQGTSEAGMLSVGKDLFILSPFIGFGLISQNATLSSNSASLFGTGFAGGTQNTSGSDSSTWFQLGAQLKLTIFTFAAEYDNLFNVSSFSGRVGLQF